MEGTCPSCNAYVRFEMSDLVRVGCPNCGADYSPEQIQERL